MASYFGNINQATGLTGPTSGDPNVVVGAGANIVIYGAGSSALTSISQGNYDIFGAVWSLANYAIYASYPTTVTVSTSGTVVGAHGVGIFGDGSTVVNAGLIQGRQFTNPTSYDGVGVVMDGTNNRIINSGTISSLFDSGIYFNGSLQVHNTGTISGEEEGIAAGSSAISLTLTNSGTIVGTSGVSFSAYGTSASATITNSGAMHGDLYMGHGINYLFNNGNLQGAYSGGTSVDYILNGAGGVIAGTVNLGEFINIILNDGTLGSSVFGGSDNDTVGNTGTVNGAVTLYAGQDTLRNNGGTIAGNVDMGIDNDTLINSGEILGTVYMGTGNDKLTSTGHIFGSVDLGEGDDLLHFNLGDLGTNTLQGGTGIDRLVNTDGVRNISVNLGASGFEFYFGTLTDETINATGATQAMTMYGGAGEDVLTGGTNNDILIGGSDNDTLNGDLGSDGFFGGQGDDALYGGDGADTLNGGLGADLIYGGAGIDTMAFSTSRTAVTVNLLTGQGSGGEAEGDSYEGMESAFGSRFDDTLIAGAVASRLEGWTGNDTLTGSALADTLIGGAGADIINGLGGVDRAYYNGSTTAIQINLATNVNTGGEAQGDSLTNVEEIYGSVHGDTIIGNSQNNLFFGINGADRLDGGVGADTLYGGADDDTFVFNLGESGTAFATMDQIADYGKSVLGTGGDKIDSNVDLAFGGTAAAATATQASINNSTGVASFFAGSGTTLADALSDITTSMTTYGNVAGDFAFFQIGTGGPFYMFISDGVAGVTANDALVRLNTVTTIGSVNITAGDVTILT